ncbi:NAD(P)-dependent dehydrogenase, short-chain alcohol dehydrogenase family [Mariniphaga anaerophila]|uniref:NAD(P)-dependent dehydrogenase, short-chain alcohol dehydrogenase family n=1 Tax=Mariniphaga anaerophila TaxID=1484053 RepID=A0A1M5DDP1_9BACT|nr:oxidoreductase [Mariniphaga anaerophila]SHF65035.1 NAD(P)-dependent dehydrogenase, short-chain alcohol dehydrogenase family [Mariniphaga anaerophila]
MKKENWTKNCIPDLTGKIVVVTGGNSGLGFESVETFAEHGARVVLACRSLEKGEKAREGIMNAEPAGTVDVAELDLASLESVRGFAENFLLKYSRLDVLLNNAGIMTTPYFQTKDGFEGQNGTNHLGHFALTGLLMPALRKTPASRVVSVSSIAHKQGKMDFGNLLFEGGKGYTPMKAYGRSKLSNLLFIYELQRFFEKEGIDCIAVAAHPGVSQTELFRYLDKKWYFRIGRPVFMALTQEPKMGALPEIRAAVDPDVKGGEFYGPSGFMEIKGYPVKVKSNAASHNKDHARKLWEVSEKLTGVRFNSSIS